MISEDKRQELADDEEYLAVTGDEGDAEKALDNVYKVIHEEIEDDGYEETLCLIPAQYIRGETSESDAELILDHLEREVGSNERVREAIEQSREFLEEN